jgi:hypothetical protein
MDLREECFLFHQLLKLDYIHLLHHLLNLLVVLLLEKIHLFLHLLM